MPTTEEQIRRDQFDRYLLIFLAFLDSFTFSSPTTRVYLRKEIFQAFKRLRGFSLKSAREQLLGIGPVSKTLLAETQKYLTKAFDKAEKYLTQLLVSDSSDIIGVGSLRQKFLQNSLVINGRRFQIDYYVALVMHMQTGKALRESTIAAARGETGLVQVSSNPSLLDNCICEEYRGKVFSVDPGNEKFPFIGAIPSIPFHPWCYHTLHVFHPEGYTQAELNKLKITNPDLFL